MAAPIAHIFLALRMLAGPLQENGFSEKEFLVGTSFPDIRYLKVVERAETHFKNTTLADVKRERNSFRAGMLFHSVVDEKREEYVVQNKLYSTLPDFRFVSQTLKFAEDQLLKEKLDIRKYQVYFKGVLNEEREFKISQDNLELWHHFLVQYFSGQLSSHEIVMKYFDLHEPQTWFLKRWFFSWFYAKKIDQGIGDIVRNSELKKLILDFYLNF